MTRTRSTRSQRANAADDAPETPAPSSAPPRRPTPEKRLTSINFSAHHYDFLAKRGARSDRAHGLFSRSNVLRRKVDLFSAVLERSNPVRTRAFPDAYVRLLGEIVPEPWMLSPDEIALFDRYIAHRPDLDDICRTARVDPEDLVHRLEQLSFSERVALVDVVEQRLVPPADDV